INSYETRFYAVSDEAAFFAVAKGNICRCRILSFFLIIWKILVADCNGRICNKRIIVFRKMGLLQRYDTGVYFIPSGSGSELSVDKVIDRKYL
ncbi:MAG: hypothetical protein LUC94_02955, partial [Clostridiales bacterium]|nr:hypothetical protein [Clostridiales bacterium]